MTESEERKAYAYRLSNLQGVGDKTLLRMTKRYKDPREIFERLKNAGDKVPEECADILNKNLEEFKKWREKPHWIDMSDYCPSAYGFGDNPTEPIWRFECSECGARVFDNEFPPDKCPNCGAVLRGGAEE